MGTGNYSFVNKGKFHATDILTYKHRVELGQNLFTQYLQYIRI
jgi:hypothetical protein